MSFNITYFNVTLCFEEHRNGVFEEVISDQKDIISSFNTFGEILNKYRHRMPPGYRCRKVAVSNESRHGPWIEIGSGLDEHRFVLSKADSRTYIRFEIESPSAPTPLLPSPYLRMLASESTSLVATEPTSPIETPTPAQPSQSTSGRWNVNSSIDLKFFSEKFIK